MDKEKTIKWIGDITIKLAALIFITAIITGSLLGFNYASKNLEEAQADYEKTFRENQNLTNNTPKVIAQRMIVIDPYNHGSRTFNRFIDPYDINVTCYYAAFPTNGELSCTNTGGT